MYDTMTGIMKKEEEKDDKGVRIRIIGCEV